MNIEELLKIITCILFGVGIGVETGSMILAACACAFFNEIHQIQRLIKNKEL